MSGAAGFAAGMWRGTGEIELSLSGGVNPKTDFAGRRVTVLGLGRNAGGVAAARYLARLGALVTVTDLQDETLLRDSMQQLSDVDIQRFVLGGHPEAVFRECDVLVVNPAVRPDHSGVLLARGLGVEITSEIELFCRANQATVIGVTGSNGKSTTSALIHHLLQQSWQNEQRRVWLGGNIGISLLDQLDRIAAGDIVVLELSSFQLELLRQRRFRPKIAVITNFSPNHLDWHGTAAAYRRAKQGILDSQLPTDAAVLPTVNGSDPGWRARARVFRFGNGDTEEDGVFLEPGCLVLRSGRIEDTMRGAQPPQLPGAHNRLNIAAAACAAWLAGADPAGCADALMSFIPLPHRLQFVAERFGRRFVNDSLATTPESAIQGLRAINGRIILLAGGYDKGQNLAEFAAEIAQHATGVVLLGQTAPMLQRLIRAQDRQNETAVRVARNPTDGFLQAVALSRPGDTVLLSPGCASFDWYRDYRDRGEQFSEMARAWTPQ